MDDSTKIVLVYTLANALSRPIVRKGTSLKQGTVSHKRLLFYVCSHKHPPLCKLFKAWITKEYPTASLFIPMCINTVCWKYVSGNMNGTLSFLLYLLKWIWKTFVIIWPGHVSRAACYSFFYSSGHFHVYLGTPTILPAYESGKLLTIMSISKCKSFTYHSETSSPISTIWIAFSLQSVC